MSRSRGPDRSRGDLGPAALRGEYRSGRLAPAEVIDEVYRRIHARDDDGVWISKVPYETARAAAEALEPARLGQLPLFGIPFSVKDNIDVAGMETTAGCPGFGYVASESAALVTALQDAGAILIGKTNLDQFATGLSGVRSPYGVPSSIGDSALIAGGSSSGAAVSVAAGLVGFAIGTDTAGSGRVPAALNGIVGMKPSVGLVSARGMVPACRSLDCASVFASSVADGSAVLAVLGGHDPADPWSRRLPVPQATPTPVRLDGLRLAVPAVVPRWGSRGEHESWTALLRLLEQAGAELVEVDLGPFLEAGELLYGGPWVAERRSGIADFVGAHPDALLPVIAEILDGGRATSGVETFEGVARLRVLRREAERVLEGFAAVLTPTVTETFTITEMNADPIALNSRLGTFTTFTNLLDLSAVAVPAGGSAVPFGVTLQADAGRDALVAGIAAAIEALQSGVAAPEVPDLDDRLRLAVVGAHLSGMPLNKDLLAGGAEFEQRTTTAATYRLFALEGGPPARPGLCRVDDGGAEIEVEVYRMPRAGMGDFLATVPAPLGIGRVRLVDGHEVLGFICEPAGLFGATDVTSYGGWRAYQRSLTVMADFR